MYTLYICVCVKLFPILFEQLTFLFFFSSSHFTSFFCLRFWVLQGFCSHFRDFYDITSWSLFYPEIIITAHKKHNKVIFLVLKLLFSFTKRMRLFSFRFVFLFYILLSFVSIIIVVVDAIGFGASFLLFLLYTAQVI